MAQNPLYTHSQRFLASHSQRIKARKQFAIMFIRNVRVDDVSVMSLQPNGLRNATGNFMARKTALSMNRKWSTYNAPYWEDLTPSS